MGTSGEATAGATTILQRLAAYGGRSALVSGVLAAVGTVFLFATMASQASTTQPAIQLAPLERLADGLTGLAFAIAIPVAVRFHQSWRMKSAGASASALTLGVVSLITYSLILLALAVAPSGAGDLGSLSVVPFGGIGLWILVVSVGAADAALRGVLRWLGIAVGVGFVLLPVGYFFGGGAAVAADPTLALESPLLIVAAIASLLASGIGYPIWAIWLARRWQAVGELGWLSPRAPQT